MKISVIKISVIKNIFTAKKEKEKKERKAQIYFYSVKTFQNQFMNY